MNSGPYCPDTAVPPGATLQENLDWLGMTQQELADRMGRPLKIINEIIKGKRAITPDTAIQLEKVLGIPANVWLNLESNYRETLARLKEAEQAKQEIDRLSDFPYAEMARLGWVPKTSDPQQRVSHLQRFFGVDSLLRVEEIQQVAYRRSERWKCSKGALAAWLRKGEIEAQRQFGNVRRHDPRRLRESLPEFRRLTQLDPEEFYSRLVKLCADCGIALSLVPHLRGTHVNGASMWRRLSDGHRAVVVLSLRHKYEDIFWFSFFHELGHVLLHKKLLYINTDPLEGEQKSDIERQTDEFAAETLIPQESLVEFIRRTGRVFSSLSIKEFAGQLEISSGIVVGRLQHEGYLEHSEFNRLRRKYESPSGP